MTIEGTTFVITGGARGIGAETGRLAAGRGAQVVLSDVLVAEGQAVVDEIEAAGGQAHFEHRPSRRQLFWSTELECRAISRSWSVISRATRRRLSTVPCGSSTVGPWPGEVPPISSD
jgi:NAD(P)-dependent dehydrogenase (short-subunit alcohol dehydrogenase family)